MSLRVQTVWFDHAQPDQRHEEQEQTQREADAEAQCLDGALGRPLVLDQVVEARLSRMPAKMEMMRILIHMAVVSMNPAWALVNGSE